MLTHGFTMDSKGFKQSKSLGNTTDPVKVMETNGADIILQAGKQEMDGLSAGLYDTQLATFQQQQAASAQRMADARDALSAQQVASAGGGKTKVVLVALVATAVLASVVVMVNRRK